MTGACSRRGTWKEPPEASWSSGPKNTPVSEITSRAKVTLASLYQVLGMTELGIQQAQ